MSAAIEMLIPHRSPMRFIDELTAVTETTATATACFASDHFAVARGQVLESALIECAAQTVAGALGQRQAGLGDKDPSSPGMLVAVTNFKFLATVPPGKIIQIEIRQLKSLGLMRMITALLTCEGQAIASGELTLYA